MFLKAEQIVSGQAGRAYANIDGRNQELLYLKSIDATVTKRKTAVRTLGHTGDQYKAAGWSGKGKMVIYYMTTLFREQMLQYMQSGKDSYFDIVVINEDVNTDTGRQTVVLKNCNLDSVALAKLNVEADNLDEEVSFTFDGAEILDSFS
ncbi:MAG TPA: phage tail tube protein [Candidatus Merdivicinus excrementipullorum]|uniref:Phage tail tube protein n=1 Tax=Candidatus Merdivicinus excrementipullorum TaxID=2840867 RepID=A0A9D1FN84_9FIRM|nr:phage tail tube protein [Candidatus Merdivicinus excrementipullorum]